MDQVIQWIIFLIFAIFVGYIFYMKNCKLETDETEPIIVNPQSRSIKRMSDKKYSTKDFPKFKPPTTLNNPKNHTPDYVQLIKQNSVDPAIEDNRKLSFAPLTEIKEYDKYKPPMSVGM
jgi:hypothetical protein